MLQYPPDVLHLLEEYQEYKVANSLTSSNLVQHGGI